MPMIVQPVHGLAILLTIFFVVVRVAVAGGDRVRAVVDGFGGDRRVRGSRNGEDRERTDEQRKALDGLHLVLSPFQK
jgi:uncharacterized membrane protein YqiK